MKDSRTGNEEPEDLLCTFHSVHDAIMGERELLDAGIDVRVMPMPRQLGPACGIVLRICPGDAEKARALQNIAGIFRRSGKGGFVPWNP
jgi:hypothetical protein